MNIYEILNHQAQIRHDVRIAHLEEYTLLEWWRSVWHKTSVKIPKPLALSSADAACSFTC